MKPGPQIALAVGVGYLLGRRRRLRLALVLAVAGATGRIAAGPSGLVSQVKNLGSGTEFGEIADTVRGPLLEASKAAVLAAIGGRLESLTDSLQERAESLSVPSPRKGADEDEDKEPVLEEDEEEAEDVEEDVEDEEDVEGEEEAETGEEYPEEEVAEEEEAPRRGRRTRASSRRSPVRRGGRR